jgi:hypothetical protein
MPLLTGDRGGRAGWALAENLAGQVTTAQCSILHRLGSMFGVQLAFSFGSWHEWPQTENIISDWLMNALP